MNEKGKVKKIPSKTAIMANTWALGQDQSLERGQWACLGVAEHNGTGNIAQETKENR